MTAVEESLGGVSGIADKARNRGVFDSKGVHFDRRSLRQNCR